MVDLPWYTMVLRWSFYFALKAKLDRHWSSFGLLVAWFFLIALKAKLDQCRSSFGLRMVWSLPVVYHGTCTMVILWPPYSKSFTGTSGGRTHDLLHASPAPCGLCYQPSRRQRCEKSNTFDGTDICASQPVKVVDVPLSACSTRDWTAVSWNGGDNWAYL